MLADVLSRALRPIDPPLAFTEATEWWVDHLDATEGLADPIDRAIAGAARVDRLAFVFAGGYAAALRALDPSLPRDVPSSFAATEEGGAHPRAIATELARTGDRWVLRGKKKWVTLLSAPGHEAPIAGSQVLVVARLPVHIPGAPPPGPEGASEQPTLRVVRVSAHDAGVLISPLSSMPFVPEIPHAELTLSDVSLPPEAVLPGDGYTRYLRPFRTIEDIHVQAALLSWLLSMASRAQWPRTVRERLCSALTSLRALAFEDPSAAEVHIALGGTIGRVAALLEESAPFWASMDAGIRERFERDRALLQVASGARAQRLSRAWERMEGEVRSPSNPPPGGPA